MVPPRARRADHSGVTDSLQADERTLARERAEGERAGVYHRSATLSLVPPPVPDPNDTDGEAGDSGRTFALALSSESPVMRYDFERNLYYWEILSHERDGVDLSRAAQGLPFLTEHDRGTTCGRVRDLRLDDDRMLRGTVLLSRSQAGRDMAADIADGIRPTVSVGYRLPQTFSQAMSPDGMPIRTYAGWQPVECSSVSIPADFAVGFGRAARDAARAVETPRPDSSAPVAQERTMSDTTSGAPAPAAITVTEARDAEVTQVAQLAREFGATDRLPEFIERKLSLSQVQQEILRALPKGDALKTGAPSVDGLSERDAERYSFARAVLLDAGEIRASEAMLEREVHDELYRTMGQRKIPTQGRGMLMPSRLSARALDSTTSTTTGGILKFNKPGDFIEILRTRLALQQCGATFLTGLTGPVVFPRMSAATSGSWVGENPGSDVTDVDATFDSVSLSFKTYQASTGYSKQLLFSALSGSYDAEAIVRNDLAAVFARAIDAAGINGSGASNQPRGVLNTASIGSVALGTNGLAIDATPLTGYTAMVSLWNAPALANADIGTQKFLINARQRARLMNVPMLGQTVSGVPVFMPGDGPNGRIFGYDAVVSNQVPQNLTKGTSTTICSAIIFGAWEHMLIGEWGAFEVITDPYRLKKRGVIEVTGFQTADVAVRYPQAFAAIQDAL